MPEFDHQQDNTGGLIAALISLLGIVGFVAFLAWLGTTAIP